MQVFISHASVDKPTVRRIAEGLTAAGLDVWLDEARIRVGDSIPQSVADALESSDLLAFCFSEGAKKSAWASRELNAFFMLAMRLHKPVLPCKIDGAQPPMLLNDLKYADFSSDFDEGMNSLLGAIGIAEAVAEAKRAEKVHETLQKRLDVYQRVWLYKLFVIENKDTYVTTTADTFDNLFKTDRRALGMLEEYGLLESDWVFDERLIELGLMEEPPTHRQQWLIMRLSPLGVRVVSRWAHEKRPPP